MTISKRVIGPLALTALVVNSVIGAGIFGLPREVAKLLAGGAPWAYALSFLVLVPITAVYALMGMRVRRNGGQYNYVRSALGRLPGTVIAWYILAVRATSAAVIADWLVTYLGELVPAASSSSWRGALIFGLVVALTVVNIRGVGDGTRVSSAFTVFKLGTLGAFIAAGFVLLKNPQPVVVPEGLTFRHWTEALAVLTFAYGGFDAILSPAGEVKSPRTTIPFALLLGLSIVSLTYLLIQLVATRAVPTLATSERPLADAARAFAGSSGAKAMSLVVVLSTLGWLTASFVTVPRHLSAMAKRRDLFRMFAVTGSVSRTPWVAILGWGVLVAILGSGLDFLSKLKLSVGARMLTYTIAACALMADRSHPVAAWRWVFGIATVAVCLTLLFECELTPFLILLGIFCYSVLWTLIEPRVRHFGCAARP